MPAQENHPRVRQVSALIPAGSGALNGVSTKCPTLSTNSSRVLSTRSTIN